MPATLAALTIILRMGMVITRFSGGFWLFHRQVLREEAYLKQHYGEEYAQYCRRVRQYL